ncbi:MAG: Hsp70 family protein [Limnospira sp. PMC 1291.21]|uniref:Chaperone protein DnaK n=2 Tax=Limnospira TaxID=2596745 RepID=A0A9P1KB48_9CYAN|nr:MULTISPECIES: Hsp70 family protein [Limnospira]MDY7052037.1 Hsp70 family protein [Limnospira fusiformis LS22]QJB28539.1 Hsp70 family protein [Limnospira fusiformis SAG 85.79]MDT9176216.1 Hsp70 family protein [Limnospira sp. PMC 1238.20]MDT9186509.1 Hsp70 family protein [Limnospira sp. PMC 894.15]MDT9191520.1 Hsp70 family protein [Limnospira sp. PMC 1245.20]
MGNIVGIDLGTTNSVAAFKWAEVNVVTAAENSPPDRKLTRSVVAADRNGLIVGEQAYRQLGDGDTENVIISIKRLIGRGFNDPVVQQQLSRFNYKIDKSSQGTENSLSVWLGGREYLPEDISAEILKKVVSNAQTYQERSGQTSRITEAVITVPAYFNDKQRYATEIATQKAGLKLRELLPEPTAAAISYGYRPDSDEVSTILVYDFGGGTLDCSIITSVGNQFIESAKSGDLWLGGDDFDNCIVEFAKQEIARIENLDNVDRLIKKMPHYQRVRLLAELKIQAEQAKIRLSTQGAAEIITSAHLIDEMGMAIPIQVTISRQEFEKRIEPLIDRSVKIAQDAIKYSDYPLDQIDAILLVGGSAQVPIVQQKIRQAFPQHQVVVHDRPMYAVAEGAAIVAAGLTEKVTTVSRDYCIELVDEPRFVIISQGDILPVQKFHTFKTEADGQSLIHFKFFSPDRVRQELDRRFQDERIGDMWLALDRPYPKGTEILVTVELDEENNSLQMTAALKNNPQVKVSCSFSRGGVNEEISRQVEERIKQLNAAGNLTEIGVKRANEIAGEVVRSANQIYYNGQVQRDRLNQAESKLKELEEFANDELDIAKIFIMRFELALEVCDQLIHEDQKYRLRNLVDQLQQALNSKNIASLQKLIEDSKREFDNLPDSVKLIVVIREEIGRIHHLNPSQAGGMEVKFNQLLNALQQGNGSQANSLLQELQAEIIPYLDRELPTGTIATGLTR